MFHFQLLSKVSVKDARMLKGREALRWFFSIKEEIERNGRGPLENGLGADSGADFHVDDVDAATE